MAATHVMCVHAVIEANLIALCMDDAQCGKMYMNVRVRRMMQLPLHVQTKTPSDGLWLHRSQVRGKRLVASADGLARLA